jgi:hypothetical protein
MVVQADYARRIFENVNIGEGDLNRYTRYINGVQSPVIPMCKTIPDFNPNDECSQGAITVWIPEGRTVYNGLLVKLQKRFSHRMQFTASYALQNDKGIPSQTSGGSGVDLNNYFQNFGPILPKHDLNISGLVNLPYGFELSVNNAIISRTPFAPYISGIDINGAGNSTAFALNEVVPGISYGCFGYSCSKSDLQKAVAYFNATYAGKKDARGVTIPTLTLPTDFQFGDPTYDTDMRLTKVFRIKERLSLSLYGEVFNVFNIANLSGYSANLANTAGFGKPTARFAQNFGSGGPRAAQIGARITF